MHGVFIDSNHMPLHAYFHGIIPAKLPFNFLFASRVPMTIHGDVAFFSALLLLRFNRLQPALYSIVSLCTEFSYLLMTNRIFHWGG